MGSRATRAQPLPLGARQRGPPSRADESDYQTEYEEELPDGAKDTDADFQSAPAPAGSDSVSCPAAPRLPGPKPASCSLPAAPQRRAGEAAARQPSRPPTRRCAV